MKTYEIKTYQDGWERDTVRGLNPTQMIALGEIFKDADVSYKKFTYENGQLQSVDWVDSSAAALTDSEPQKVWDILDIGTAEDYALCISVDEWAMEIRSRLQNGVCHD